MDERVVIALFRHGLTPENERGAYIGWTDVSLSENGIKGVNKTKEQINQYDAVFTSDLKRCLETADLLFPDESKTLISDFREMNFGVWEGKTYEDLQSDLLYRSWIDHFYSEKPPEGESFAEFSHRIENGFVQIIETVMEKKLSNVAIVTHGGVIRSLLMKYAPIQKDFWDWKIPHGTGYELEWSLEELRRGNRCTSLRVVPLTESQLG